MKKNNQNNSGMTIIEVLVSVVIISLVMSLLFTLLIQVQNANAATAEKSSLLISQAVITKSIEQDMIEIGLKAVSKCDLSDLNIDLTGVDTTKESICLRIEYNVTYDINDLAFLVIYKQKDNGYNNKPSWIMKYSRGYYDGCEENESPDDTNSWIENYVVVQKLPQDVDIGFSVKNPKITVSYSANTDNGQKYALQKSNTGNINIIVQDLKDNFRYDLDFAFSYRLYYNVAKPKSESRFYCDYANLECKCAAGFNDTDCRNTYVLSTSEYKFNSHKVREDGRYKYLCSETKYQSAVVSGLSNSFWKYATSQGVSKNNVKEVKFYLSYDDVPERLKSLAIDVSKLQNGSVMLFPELAADNNYILHFSPGSGRGNEGVIMAGKSMEYLFSGCTNLTKIDFTNFNSAGIENMGSLFSGCEKLTNEGIIGFTSLNFDSVTNMSNIFMNCKALKHSPFRYYDRDGNNRENVNYNNNSNEYLNLIRTVQLKALTNASYMFAQSGLTSFTLTQAGDKNSYDNITDIDAPNLVDMSNMLEGSDVSFIKIYSITLNNLKVMVNFAHHAVSLTDYTPGNATGKTAKTRRAIYISDFTAPNLETLSNAFKQAGNSSQGSVNGSGKVSIYIKNFYTGKLKDVSRMFADASLKKRKLNQDASKDKFDDTDLYEFYINGWWMPAVENMSYMFYRTPIVSFGFAGDAYTSDKSSNYIYGVVLHENFYYLGEVTPHVRNTSHMFDECIYFEEFYGNDRDLAKVTDASYMFKNTRLSNIHVGISTYYNNGRYSRSYFGGSSTFKGLDTGSVLNNASFMFFGTGNPDGSSKFEGVFDPSFWSNVDDFSFMFTNSKYQIIDMSGINSKVIYNDDKTNMVNMNYMFAVSKNWNDYPDDCSTVNTLDHVCNDGREYSSGGLGTDETTTIIKISDLKLQVHASAYKMFSGRNGVKELYIDNLFNTTDATDTSVTKTDFNESNSNANYRRHVFSGFANKNNPLTVYVKGVVPAGFFESMPSSSITINGKKEKRDIIIYFDNDLTKQLASNAKKGYDVRNYPTV